MEILKKSLKILQNFGKLAIFFVDLKSMTNYLLFETNGRVLAQLVEKCQFDKDSYFQVQQKVKKTKITSEFQGNVVPKQIVQLS